VNPPNLSTYDQTAKGCPKVAQMTMTVEEKEVTSGVFVELTLRNSASNSLVHSIDFHGSTVAL
jgi:hypothetical protein